ncbi:MAG TPA: MDR family MFS transporter [Micromonosporaceae bacterium]|nr:MDR family MFS transporter [Micromonosporaceae bacterium]
MMTTNTAALTAPQRSTDSKRGLVLLFVGLMLSMLLAALNQTVLSTALPTMVGELNGVDQMLWVITAYILASTVAMPAYGKLGDLIGRKGLLITAISLFVAGSVFGALAQDMSWLIVGRSIQGLGGGGLMILSQAIIADVIPARERGKYMGAMGGVFAFASVAGPLLGGWFTEGPGWRWAFWINIPLGAVAVLAAIFFLHLSKGATVRPRVDYAGMGLLGIATTCLVLLSTWGGGQYAWTSPTILGLAAGAIVAGVALVLVERRAAEPILPLHLFKDLNFNLTTLGGLILGVAMFGPLAYLPTYLQMVTGASATAAGLLMIPMMGSLLLTSMLSGFYVSRTGRYKWLTVAGSVVVAVGLVLLSTMQAETPVWLICCYLAVLGLGLGPGMQLLVLIVQNSFPAAQVGTATAANNFFRQIGATLGTAVVGSIFTGRLAFLLAERLPTGAAAGVGGPNSLTPATVNALPEALRQPIITSYSEALTPVFLYMLPLAIASAVLLCFIKEKALATTLERDRPAEIGDEGQPAQSDHGYGGRHDTGPEVGEKDPLPIR